MREAGLSCEYIRSIMNALLASWDTAHGYCSTNLPPSKTDSSDSLFMMASFSGDGAGASTLSYGMLQEMARTPIAWKSRQERLVDELNITHAVSGAALPQLIMLSMAIALFRISRLASSERIGIATFEQRFSDRRPTCFDDGLPILVALISSANYWARRYSTAIPSVICWTGVSAS